MKIDLLGQTFNCLTVIAPAESTSAGAMWLCVCSCGKQTVVNSLKLRTGKTKSCGHLTRSGDVNRKHGLANKSRTYKTWKEMRRRCVNPNASQYKWYGAKGIAVCERWNDYELFLEDMGERPDGCTLDRIDPDKGYSKDNCRWATPKQQAETNRGCFVKGMTPWNKGVSYAVG